MTVKAKREIVKAIGRPADVARELKEFKASAMLLSSDSPRLIDLYEDQWVAVYNGKTVASAAGLPELLRKVDKKHIPRGRVIVRRIDREPRTMIL